MRLSVIIPVYNGGKYLGRSVSSIQSQSCKDKRIIIVDDGSTDDTPEISDALARKYDNIHVIHQENGGVSKARNTAIDYILSTSEEKEFIGFCDADDEWEKNIVSDKILNDSYDSDMISFSTHYEYSDRNVAEIRGGQTVQLMNLSFISGISGAILLHFFTLQKYWEI